MEQPTSFSSTTPGTTHASQRDAGDAKLPTNIPRRNQESSLSDSPSVMSSCLSEAVAEGDENASFCDPFSDDEEDLERPSESLRSAGEAIGAAISVDSVLARNATGAFAAIRPHTSAIDSAASATNMNTASLAPSVGIATRICGLVSIADALSLSASAASGVVQGRGYTARPSAAHNRNFKDISSRSQASEPQRRERHVGHSGDHGCYCCNYTGVRTSRVD